jgi:hypothetical protein
MGKTTILVESATAELLRHIGNKGQTYDYIINELIRTKRKDSKNSSDRRLDISLLTEPKNSQTW